MIALQIFATVAGLLAVSAVSIWALIFAVAGVADAIRAYRERKSNTPPFAWRFPSDIDALGRWCGWHFPIIEDVERWLMDRANGRDSAESIESFRESLFRKYGKREESNG